MEVLKSTVLKTNLIYSQNVMWVTLTLVQCMLWRTRSQNWFKREQNKELPFGFYFTGNTWIIHIRVLWERKKQNSSIEAKNMVQEISLSTSLCQVQSEITTLQDFKKCESCYKITSFHIWNMNLQCFNFFQIQIYLNWWCTTSFW